MTSFLAQVPDATFAQVGLFVVLAFFLFSGVAVAIKVFSKNPPDHEVWAKKKDLQDTKRDLVKRLDDQEAEIKSLHDAVFNGLAANNAAAEERAKVIHGRLDKFSDVLRQVSNTVSKIEGVCAAQHKGDD